MCAYGQVIGKIAGGGMGVMRLIVVLIAAFGLAGCGGAEQGQGDTGEPVIVASIFPLADLAQQVVGDEFEVEVLLPPGVTPHGFELTPDQLRTLHNADVLIVTGTAVDSWAQRAAKATGKGITIISMAKLVNDAAAYDDHDAHAHDAHNHDHAHDHAGPNPHLWLDPVRTAAFVEALGQKLSQRYPEQGEAIYQHTASLLDTIHAVDQAYREQVQAMPRKQLVTFHNAFDLVAQRYGLEVVTHLTPIEMAPGGEVTWDRIREAVEAIRQYKLQVIYAEPQFPDAAVKSLQRESGAKLLRLDPLGHPQKKGYENWQAMMRSNLAVLVQGQGTE